MESGTDERLGGSSNPLSTDKTPDSEATITRGEADKERAAAVQQALSQAGRDAAGIQAAQAKAETTLATAKKLLDDAATAKERLREREIEAVSEDPEKLTAVQLKHKAEREREAAEKATAEAEALRVDADARMVTATEATKTVLANALAVTYGVDANQLLELTDGSAGKMEKLAKSLQEMGSEPTAEADKDKTSPSIQRRDSARSQASAGGKFTLAKVEGYDARGKTVKDMMTDAQAVIDQMTSK